MTKIEAMNEILNGVNHDTFINYLTNYEFSEDEIRIMWDKGTPLNWLKHQDKNMSKDFKREMSNRDEYTKLIIDSFEIEKQVLSYDWTKTSKNRWNQFKKFVKDNLYWNVSNARGCNDYKTLVEYFVDDYKFKRFDERDKHNFINRMNQLQQQKIDAYKELLDHLF